MKTGAYPIEKLPRNVKFASYLTSARTNRNNAGRTRMKLLRITETVPIALAAEFSVPLRLTCLGCLAVSDSPATELRLRVHE